MMILTVLPRLPPTLHRPQHRPQDRSPIMSELATGEGYTSTSPVGPDVSEAAVHLKNIILHDEEEARRQRIISDVLSSPLVPFGEELVPSSHLQNRDSLVGTLCSSALLAMDERAGLWPLELENDSTAMQLPFVYEPDCIGCGFCPAIARKTFAMGANGKARVTLQGEPSATISEAIDSCPADCIHLVSRHELELLESQREHGSFPWLSSWNDQVAATAYRNRAADPGPRFPGIAEQAARVEAQRERTRNSQDGGSPPPCPR